MLDSRFIANYMFNYNAKEFDSKENTRHNKSRVILG